MTAFLRFEMIKRLLVLCVLPFGIISCGAADIEIECSKLNILVQRMSSAKGTALGQLKIRANPIARKIQKEADLDVEAVKREDAYKQAHEFCSYLRDY